MSSILNSISPGELQVHQVPEVKPVKEDSIIDLLKDSEIEFKHEEKHSCSQDIEIPEFIEITKPKEEPKIDIEIFLPELPIEVDENQFDTGFSENQDLLFDTPCKPPELKTPLYQENYLREFKTEEEKAAARHALGLYNRDDIVAMSLLTTKEDLPNSEDWEKSSIKQMRQGDTFFTPITTTKAVYDSFGVTLDVHLNDVNRLITEQQKTITSIIEVSKSDQITSLGDVRVFLQGFNNGENLHNTLDQMNQDMLRFEKTGEIL